MPSRLQKPCSYPGCTYLAVGAGRCSEHPRVVVRDKQRQRLYGRAWQRTRANQLAQYPWCADCLAHGQHTLASEVHHEQRHEGDAEKFLNSPLQSLCKRCHSRHTIHEVIPPHPKKL